jgi:hypothetical protein
LSSAAQIYIRLFDNVVIDISDNGDCVVDSDTSPVLQPVDAEVAVDSTGLEPPSDPADDAPSAEEQVSGIAAAGLSTCSPCSLTTCYQLMAVGAAPKDQTALQNVLANAFSTATQLTSNYFISANVTSVAPASGSTGYVDVI